MNVLVNGFKSTLVVTAVLLSACSDDSDHELVNVEAAAPVTPAAPFQVLLDQGIGRYLGDYSPMQLQTNDQVTTHTFGTGDGPLCLDGSAYKMATRDTGSENLMVFLQGGGACWSGLCAANETAIDGIPAAGVLNATSDDNPFRQWNVAYFNYCDGSLHAGDKDSDVNGDGSNDRFQRGLHNLSAGLDVTVAAFPAPKRIALVGVSGGGFGTIFALPLLRSLYPDVEIDVVNDSGVGIGRPGAPEFQQQLFDDWNLEAFLPKDCTDCIADGNFTKYIEWQLQEDANMRLAMLSFLEDSTIANFYTGIGAEAFRTALVGLIDNLETAQPQRVRGFLKVGEEHTFLINRLNEQIDGVSVSQWLEAMLAGEAQWKTLSEASQ